MNNHPSQVGSVCAIIIAYNPGSDLLHNVSLLNRQVDAIVIVDNASSDAALYRINELRMTVPCTVIRNEKNLGIAAALNVGFCFAIEQGYEWLVTFDQDSKVTEGFIDALLDAARSSADIGIVCPTYMDQPSRTAITLPKTPSGEPLTTMTSGSMLHRDTFLRVGPFDERLFIDSVDTEYSFRVRSMGLHLVQSERAVLLHSLGKRTIHRFLGKRLITSNHSAARRYYMTRNRLFIFSRFPQESSWLRFELRAMLMETVGIVLFEKHKLAKLRFMLKGAIDYACGNWGPQIPL